MISSQFKVKWNIMRLLQSSDGLQVSHCTIVLVASRCATPVKAMCDFCPRGDLLPQFLLHHS